MQDVIKEKVSNIASKFKEKIRIYRAKMEEKVEVFSAKTNEQKVMAHERRMAKVAKAKMELHQAKARHACKKQNSKLSHHHKLPYAHGMETGGDGMAAHPPPGGYPIGHKHQVI